LLINAQSFNKYQLILNTIKRSYCMNIAKTIQDLYARFGRLEGVTIECQKELVAIGVTNSVASAEIFLQGAQISRFKRKQQSPILFLSSHCSYKQGQPLRGGIPICWPWFGQLKKNDEKITDQYKDADLDAMPTHGCVRDISWQVNSIETPSHDITVVEFSLDLNPKRTDESGNVSKTFWPFLAQLRYRVEVGEQLTATLTVSNQDSQEFSYSAALHSYFSVNHINNVIISGFSKTTYVDAVDAWKEKKQVDDIAFNKEVDRIYKSAPTAIVLSDRNRIVEIASEGSKSTVVWNPWIEKSRQLPQFADDEYQSMVCIETANVLDDIISLNPGETHSLALTIA
jgi:glucose-6-phosphate 1-epimerase